MNWLSRFFHWYGPPSPPDPLHRIAQTMDAGARQRGDEIEQIHDRLNTMVRTMNDYRADVTALQAQNKQLRTRVDDLSDRIDTLDR